MGTVSLADTYRDRAAELLQNARLARGNEPPLLTAGYINALAAAELAGKALLVMASGSHPRDHNISGALAYHGLVPVGVDERDLGDLFNQYFPVRYGTALRISERDLETAITIAAALIEAAQRWPEVKFHKKRAPI